MIAYGTGPALDEFEVVVFGPGYGEAIAVHLADGRWVLADSCIDPHSKAPASLTYLTSIGVSPKAVKVIVATHWHDDHVRGISRLAANCTEAEIQLSAAFNTPEAQALLAAYSGQAAPALTRGTQELFSSIQSRENVYHLHHRSSVHEFKASDGRQMRVVAMSPSQAAVTQSVAHLAQFLPVADGKHSIGHVTPLKPNSESVVLHIDFGGDAVLLGSDLEDHADLGWTAVAADGWSQERPKASVYKVAHHGSHTGDCDHIWTRLLQDAPVAALTPFNKGKQALPTVADLERLSNRTKTAYISSRAGRRPRMDAATAKRLGDVVKGLMPMNNGFGAVRMRKKPGSTWSVECFGDAHAL